MKKTYLYLSFFLFFALNTLSAQNPNIYFDIVNERVVAHPTLGTSTAFDVMMYADQTGTYHSRGQLYIRYSVARFGTTVNLNGNVLVEKGTLANGDVNFLGSLIPFYQTIGPVDNKENVLALTWLSNFLNILPTPAAHNAVPLTPTLLYTYYMKVQNTSAPSLLSFETQNMIGQQFYLTNNAGAPREVPYGNGFLPVELLDFKAEKLENQHVELSWATASELNNDHFVIEKSHENGSFFPVGKVMGAGTSDEIQTYAFVDESNMQQVNYYRLKQVDLDGTAKYSNIVNVHFELNQLEVYPSPTEGDVFIKYMGELAGGALVKVTDLSGRILIQKQHHFGSTNEVLQLDFSTFAKGMYVVLVTKPNGTLETHRVMKLK